MTTPLHLKVIVIHKITVWDALIAWRDDILKKDVLRETKIFYLSNMSKLIEQGMLDLEQSISEFQKTRIEERLKLIETVQNWSKSIKLSRGMSLRSFSAFIKQKKIKPSNVIIPFKEFRNLEKAVITELFSSNEIKVQSQKLDGKKIRQFLVELCRINPRDSLICWMMWEFKCTIHQLLDLRIKDIDFSKDIINFKDEMRLSPCGGFRLDLRQCMLEHIKGKSDSDLLFTTDKGNRIHAGQIIRNMKLASKRAKLTIILSPKILYAHAKAYAEESFNAMSEDERKKISEEYVKKSKALYEKVKKMLAR